jgi:transcriptional regulator of acetoin/glycerol metabolism
MPADKDDLRQVFDKFRKILRTLNQELNVVAEKLGYGREISSALRDATANTDDRIEPLAQTEKRAIVRSLVQHHWDMRATAEALGIGRTTLYRRLKKYGLAAPYELGHAKSQEMNEGAALN